MEFHGIIKSQKNTDVEEIPALPSIMKSHFFQVQVFANNETTCFWCATDVAEISNLDQEKIYVRSGRQVYLAGPQP